VGAWREFISWVQVQVLFERIPRGRATRLREHLAGKSGNVSRCTKCPHDIWNYFLCELQRVRERKNDIHDEMLHQMQSTIPIPMMKMRNYKRC
jgi:hypothetical protein